MNVIHGEVDFELRGADARTGYWMLDAGYARCEMRDKECDIAQIVCYDK